MPRRDNRQPAGRPAVEVRRPGSLSGFTSSRARILRAMRELSCEQGYQRVSVTALLARARVSSRTFYENFAGVEDCFIAAYDEATGEVEAVMRPAYMRPGEWAQRVHAALEALLCLLEADRELARLVFLEAPKARELLAGRRARILEILRLVLDSGRSGEAATATPALIDELLVEGALSVIRARLEEPEERPLSGLVEQLMGVITYSYIGAPAAVVAAPRLSPGQLVARSRPAALQAKGAPVRMTYRTLRVLTALAECPGASNRTAGAAAGIGDQGQISRLLRRLSEQGLVRNEGPHRNGAPKRWHLTESGLASQQRGQADLERRGARPAPSPQAWVGQAR